MASTSFEFGPNCMNLDSFWYQVVVGSGIDL